MKRLALAAAAAALLSTAIPATSSAGAAPVCCTAGTGGEAGHRPAPRQVNCGVSTKLNCRPALPFWLP